MPKTRTFNAISANETPELVALRDHITRSPKLSDDQQRALLVDLLSAEAAWLDALLERHGTKAHEALADIHDIRPVTAWFRLRQTEQKKFFDAIRAAEWDQVAKTPINFRFVDWARPHARPTAAMRKLERAIIAARHSLIESVLALIYKQSKAFHIGSKIQSATLADLIAIGTIGAMNGTDKYLPDGEPSAKTWKSVLLGRMLQTHLEFSKAQTVVHLYPTDSDRLVELRAGRVAGEDMTDDDIELLGIGQIVPIAMSASSYVENDGSGSDEWDLADLGLNPEEAMIAREEAAEREAKIAALPPGALKPKHKGGPGKGRQAAVRNITTGSVFESAAAAALSIGAHPSSMSYALANKTLCKGYRFERVTQ